jgi:hypothetical protein
MSSDQVINQIIKRIVSISTEKLNAREDKVKSQPENNILENQNETAPVEKIDSVPNIFMKGINSKIQNYHITDTLAAFMIRAIVLDPNNRFQIEKELSHEEVDRLIELCVSKITATTDFEMETIRMQVYFDTNFPSQGEYLQKEHMFHLEHCAALLRDIVQVKTKTIPSLEGISF